MIGVKAKLATAFVVFWKKLFVAIKDGIELEFSVCVNNGDLAAFHRRNWLHNDFLVVSMNSLAGVNSPGISPLLPVFRALLRIWQGRMCVRTFSFLTELWFSGILEKLQPLSLLVWTLLSVFWNSIKIVSWLPSFPDKVSSSWSKLSIAPWRIIPGLIDRPTGTLNSPASYITLWASLVSIRVISSWLIENPKRFIRVNTFFELNASWIVCSIKTWNGVFFFWISAYVIWNTVSHFFVAHHDISFLETLNQNIPATLKVVPLFTQCNW